MNFLTGEEELDLCLQDQIDRLHRSVQPQLDGRVRNFRVLLQDDGLILQGDALTYYAKQLAQHAIMKETRLPILANEIEVEVSFTAPAFLGEL
jgi:hypothetical protein